MRKGYFHFRLQVKQGRYDIQKPDIGVNYDWSKARTLVEELSASEYNFFTDAAFSFGVRRPPSPSSGVSGYDIVWTEHVVLGGSELNLFTNPNRVPVDRREFVEPPQARRIFVVHGRNTHLRDEVARFLEALGLSTITWNDAIQATRQSAPFIIDIVSAGMTAAQAVVVLLTPDEDASLRPEFGAESGALPRPNVLVEAGMAMAFGRNKTILVQVGEVRPWSDFHGIQSARLDQEGGRANLRTCLENAGCIVKLDEDWERCGNFVS
jgi:predicted nucleotide-binding protein